MRKKLTFLLILILNAIALQAQMGKTFPELTGENFHDKKIIIPHDTKGKYTLLALAYSKKAEEDLMTWFNPVYTTFIEKSKPGLFNESYDVNIYFIPMFTGVNQAAAGTAKKKMKEGIDQKLFPYLLLYKGELDRYQKELALDRKDTPYFFVLNKEGEIIHASFGPYSEAKMGQIESLLEE